MTEEIKEVKGPFELPKDWRWVELGDLCEVLNGRAYKQAELLKEGTPVLRVGNLFTSKHWYYSDLELEENKYCDNGDLLYAWSASFGPFIWNGGKVIYHYHIWKLNLNSNIEKIYLYYFLLWITEKIKAQGRGASMSHMTKGKMEKLEIPLPFKNNKPDIDKQKQIVEQIETTFKQIDKAKELREVALKKTQKVFQNVLDKMFREAKEDKKNWNNYFLKDITKTEKGKKPFSLKSDKTEKYKIPYLTADYFRKGEASNYTNSIDKLKVVNPNDLLMLWDGSKSGDVFFSDIFGILSSTMVNIKTKMENLNLKYLYYFIYLNYSTLNTSTTGSGIPHVSKDKFGNLEIPIPYKDNKPDLKKQEEIANYLDNLQQKIKKLEDLQDLQLKKIDKFKENYLNKVFGRKVENEQ